MVDVSRYRGRVEEIELSPLSVIAVNGDVRSCVAYFPPMYSRESLMGRVADILRRAGTEDAENLIRDLELRLAQPENNTVLTVGFDKDQQRITVLHNNSIE